jgi:superoxide dismutase, Fe-Mn family
MFRARKSEALAMSFDLDRRNAMLAGLATGAAILSAGCATAQTVTPTAATGYGAPQPKPLPFDPKTIPGFSEKILVSHHDNNYVGAVNRIGAIRGELAKLDMATAPGFMLNGLKREELLATNSMILHEVYFGGLGKGGSQPGARLGAQLEKDFGSHAKWRAEFVGMGKALGGGSGWVLLTWSPRLGQLTNQWAADHSMTVADSKVLVALDMYEHAYQMDFGAKAAAYVDAFMGALDWANADRAFG